MPNWLAISLYNNPFESNSSTSRSLLLKIDCSSFTCGFWKLLITFLAIFNVYFGLTDVSQIISIKTPSIDTYWSLVLQHPSLACPCQNIDLLHGKFIQVTPVYHQVESWTALRSITVTNPIVVRMNRIMLRISILIDVPVSHSDLFVRFSWCKLAGILARVIAWKRCSFRRLALHELFSISASESSLSVGLEDHEW